VNLWIKRALGAAALGGGLLAVTAGAAGAQEVSADVSARLGRPTAAEVRVCADGRLLSRLVGGCSQAGSGTTGSVQADRPGGVRVRARVPRLASADVSIGTRRSRPLATVSADASAATRPATADAGAGADSSPRADADAAASLSRPRAGRLLDLDATASLAGVGLLGTSPFTLVGDPAGEPLLAIGDLTLADVAGEAPAGIGVLDAGPIASGNQATVDVGDVSPSVPVTVCGNGVGVLGDASAACTPAQPAPAGPSASGPSASASTGPSSPSDGSLLANLAAGNQVDAGIGGVSPSVPVTVCGNGVGALGDASASCGTAQPSGSGGSTPAGGSPAGGSDDPATVGTGGISPAVPVTVCGNGVGLLGDASVACAADTSTGGITAPPPGTTTPGGSTDTDGIQGTPGSTGTSGIPGTTTGLTPGTDGLTLGTGGGAGDPVTTFSPLRPSVADALPFTGGFGDLLALVAAGLLAAGALIVRAARPAGATEGGGDR
jgi:hypothetical protein